MQQQQTISQSDCDRQWKVNFIRQPVTTTQWLDLKEAPKRFLGPNLHQKKDHGHCLVACCPSDPLQFSESRRNCYIREYVQQIDKRHWKLQHLQPALFNRKDPILLLDNAQPHIAQPRIKSWTNWAIKFCLICHIHLTSCWPTTASSSILTTFAGKMFPQPAGGGKCFLGVLWILKHKFYATGINKLISHWQKYVDCDCSYFD